MDTSRQRDHEDLLRTGPFPDALRAALAHRGLTLERVQERLRRRGVNVSVTSLSYWQAGRSRPERPESLRAIREIENIVGVPPHTLSSLLGPPRPRGRQATSKVDPQSFDGLLDLSAPLAETMKEVVGPWDAKQRLQVVDERITLDAEGVVREIEARLVVRAQEAAPDRHMVVFVAEPGSSPSVLDVQAIENCRVGRVRHHEDEPVIVAELLFDTALLPGETHLLHFKLVVDGGLPSTDYRRAFRFPADNVVLSVVFDPDKLPVHVRGFVEGRDGRAVSADREIALSASRIAHVAERDLSPGVVGIRWEWE